MPFIPPDRATLPSGVEVLKDLVLDTMRRANIAAQDARDSIERLELQLVALRRAVFGVRSERLTGQADLFTQAAQLPLPPQATQRVSYERRRRGRPALPADLPRTRIEYDLNDDEKGLRAGAADRCADQRDAGVHAGAPDRHRARAPEVPL